MVNVLHILFISNIFQFAKISISFAPEFDFVIQVILFISKYYL